MQRWIDEKQKGNLNINVECPQCNTAYVIRLPHPTFVVSILDSGDLFIQKICPIITGGACVGSMYWTILTFGAVTLMQTVGHDRALIMMEKTDPMVLLVSLPLIPVGLIIGQMIRWEETVRHTHTGAKIRILSENSQFENIIFQKSTISMSHFSQNSQFRSLIFHKTHSRF